MTLTSASVSFPQDGRAWRERKKNVAVRYDTLMRQDRVVRRERILPHLVALACARITEQTGIAITPETVVGREIHGVLLAPPRRWIYFILRNHPDAKLSYSVIGEAFSGRDHTTILYQVHWLSGRFRDGFNDKDRLAINFICRELEPRGFREFHIGKNWA